MLEYKHTLLVPRVKMCFVLNKYIKHSGESNITMYVVAKEIFSILSKQIIGIQLKSRLQGQNAVLDIDDNDYYLKEFLTPEEVYTELSQLFPIIKDQTIFDHESFEKPIMNRLLMLIESLILSLSKQSVDK